MGEELGQPGLQELRYSLPSEPAAAHDAGLHRLHDQISHDTNSGHHLRVLDLVR